MVGSAEFVPIAEDTGQISSVEYYALERVAQAIAELEKKGVEYESIAIAPSGEFCGYGPAHDRDIPDPIRKAGDRD